MIQMFRLPLALVFCATSLAPDARAGDVSVSFQKHGKHGSFGISIGNRHAQPPRHYAPRREWVPGHYETIGERIWVAAREDRIWVEPLFETHYDPCGRATQVCVRAGYWTTVCVPAHYENRQRQVWCAGYFRVISC